MAETDDEAELPRVKKVPMVSTWSCPQCNHQNTYREGVVSDPQNRCRACEQKVIVGAIRSTDTRATVAPLDAEVQQVIDDLDEAARYFDIWEECSPSDDYKRLRRSIKKASALLVTIPTQPETPLDLDTLEKRLAGVTGNPWWLSTMRRLIAALREHDAPEPPDPAEVRPK